ncbi:hypothetical protein JCM10450v2_002029 [Rhodotorula kratochvilovae]
MSLETEVTDELRDPTQLSAQEWTDELVEAVRRDDLLGVVVVLRFATPDEVNGRSMVDRLTALEADVSSPVVRLDLRLLIAECLLLSSAESASALQLAQAVGADELGQVLQGWSSGGREAGTTVRWLCDSSTALGHVEEWIEEAGFGVLDEGTATSPATEEQSAETFSAAKPVTPLASTSPMSSESVFKPSPPLLSILEPQAAPPASVLDTAPTPSVPLQDDDRATAVAGAIRVSSSPRRRPSPPSADPLEFWADVSDISPTLSERYLFDVLKSIGVVMEDCLMAPHAGLARRFAYIGLHTKADLEKTIEALDLRDTGDGPLSAHPFFDRRANATRPDFGGCGRAQEAYLGPERNAANAPHPRARTLILKHLPEWATTARVVEFVESALGPRAVQALSLHQPKGKTDQVALVDLDHHDDALKAFTLLDGATFDTRGICVLWRTDKAARPARRANSPEKERNIPFDVDFGCLHADDARAALRANKVQPAFPNDKQRQLQYDMFLRAQAGESREWYMAFLAHLAEFNALGGGFVARARELVEGSAYPTLEVPLD